MNRIIGFGYQIPMMQGCLLIMENSIYQIKINPKKSFCTWDTQCMIVSYKTVYMQVQAKPKSHKYTNTEGKL